MAKRIQMRKNRFLAIQKIADQKKAGLDAAHEPPPGPPGEGDHAPKQTVSVASQNCSTIPRGHDAPHAQPHGVTTPQHRHQHHRGMITRTSSVAHDTHLLNLAEKPIGWRIVRTFCIKTGAERKSQLFCAYDIAVERR
jgi:hypothetical protein